MRSRKKTLRPRRYRRKTVLVVVEGSKNKSEQVYFQKLNQQLRSDGCTAHIYSEPAGGEPSKALKQLKKIIARKGDTAYDLKCLVVDDDGHPKLQETIEQAKKDGIHVLVTNPKFELWLLWHIKDCAHWISGTSLDREVIKSELVTTSDPKALSANFPMENYKFAVHRAKKVWPELKPNSVGKNPSSAIAWLIEKIS